jgi:hypothetical protein
MVGVAEPDRHKPKRKHDPRWVEKPENVARRNREARARKKALQDELSAVLARYGLTLTEFVEGVNSGRIEIVRKQN